MVERKEVKDLMASAFDGRLNEQRLRMHQFRQNNVAGTDGMRKGQGDMYPILSVSSVWTVLLIEGNVKPDTFRATENPDVRYKMFVKTALQQVLDGMNVECNIVVRIRVFHE